MNMYAWTTIDFTLLRVLFFQRVEDKRLGQVLSGDHTWVVLMVNTISAQRGAIRF